MCFGSTKSKLSKEPIKIVGGEHRIQSPLSEESPWSDKTFKTDKITFENRHKSKSRDLSETSPMNQPRNADDLSNPSLVKTNSKKRSSIESNSSSNLSSKSKTGSKKSNSKGNQVPDSLELQKFSDNNEDRMNFKLTPSITNSYPERKDFTGGPGDVDSVNIPLKLNFPPKEKGVGTVSNTDSSSSQNSSQASSSKFSSKSSLQRPKKKRKKQRIKPVEKVFQPIYVIICPSRREDSRNICQNMPRICNRNATIPTIPPASDKIFRRSKKFSPVIVYGDSCSNNSTSSVHYCQCSEKSNSIYSLSDIL